MKVLIIILSIIVICAILLYHTWVPKTNKLRVAQKNKGMYTFYRAELYRPLFGWSGFDASKYTGDIWVSNSWTDNKDYCDKNIKVYKNLKNIK